MGVMEVVEDNKGYEKNHYLVMEFGMELMEDVKPSNIYVLPDGTIKLGDFSISRSKKGQVSAPAQGEGETGKSGQMTPNITTRYYRAPEIIYGSRDYDESIDIWGLGCTLAELVLHQPIFPGTTDIQQLELIFSVIGYPVF
ncbi:unnamed protein product [Sphagnum balticum]